MNEDTADRFRRDLLAWADGNLREFPWRRPEASLYEVFVAEFFLTQTPASNVATVYPAFLEAFPSLHAIRAADVESVTAAIEPLGFQNMRAEALKAIAAGHEDLPTDPESLEALPRVGPYVANATLCFAHGIPLPILDRNVERVYSRLFGDEWPSSRRARETAAEAILPDADARRYNLALLDFGADVCGPTPRCEACFATDYCEYYREQT